MPQGTEALASGRFSRPENYLAGLDAEVAASLITAAADLVLVVDEAGVIQDVACGNEELTKHGYRTWIGKAWSQTVTVESRPKVEAMLKEVGSGKGVKWRHVNHPSADGSDLPLSYSVVPVPTHRGAKPRRPGHALAFGRDLRANMELQQRLVSAQLSMEQGYWRLRHVETRYRLLFQVASEAILILDATTEKLEEGNPAAFKLLGEGMRQGSWTLASNVSPADAEAVRDLFARLRASGRAEPVSIRLPGQSQPLMLSASLFRQENSSHFLVRVTPSEGATHDETAGGKQLLLNVVESAPDALVVTDLDGRILTVNHAFLELVQLTNEALVRGESLEKWLGRTGVDLNVLISNLRQSGSVRLFATSLRGEYGTNVDVEISAVSVPTGEQPCLGFTIRDVGRRLSGDARVNKELPRSAGQMTELVGRVPLKDIVRETTDLIEQLCIEAALELTGDNRASAAEMLGLSRQSLYVKLRRFGIGEAVAEE